VVFTFLYIYLRTPEFKSVELVFVSLVCSECVCNKAVGIAKRNPKEQLFPHAKETKS